MTHREKNRQDIVEKHLALFNSPPFEEMEEARKRILSRLRSETFRPIEESPNIDSKTVRPRWWWQAAVGAAAAAAIVLGLFVGIPRARHSNSAIDVHAVVESADGGLFRITGGEALHAREEIESGDVVRTDGGVGTVLTLADASRIEMRPESTLSLEPAKDGVRIHLDTGGVIVTAAKQKTGHLYVQTKDLNVSVVGTVFMVNTEEAGSRVAVIQGSVVVQQGAQAKTLRPGEQATTNPLLEAHPIREEIGWSRTAERHMALLQTAAPPVAQAARDLEFEAASLRESQMDPRNPPPSFVECRGSDGIWSYAKEVAAGGPGTVSPVPVPQGRCVGLAPVQTYISAAYGIRPNLISGVYDKLPMQTKPMGPITVYQLEAKSENPATATKDELRQMLQNFIVKRFNVKAHRYTQEQPGYLLLAAKTAVKFKETSGDEDLPHSQIELPPGFVLGPGAIMTHVIKGKFSLKRFAEFLSGPTTESHPVIDKTELPGLYDITLRLNQVVSPPGVRGQTSGPQPEMWDPPLAKALEEQLGLRLQSIDKVPVEHLLVDQLEKPSEN